jgi:LDH2 family malate/lactate/ureidoglycolate dehydrogenase
MISGGTLSSTAIAPEELKEWTVSILRAAGASHEAAVATACCLVGANQRGIDSHGVVFLRFYLPRLRAGTTNGHASPEVRVDLPALALVDGHHGLGAHIASFAMSLCCDKAKSMGAAVVTVRNSGHFGAASYYTEIAAARGCIGIAVSNSDPGMAPLGALGPILGTNPLAIAVPAATGLPTPSLDIATSVVAQGRIILASRAGTTIPSDWAIGPDGRSTHDPAEALAGAMLPMAGYKGFGLAFMIDVLAGCLPGALISPDIPSDPGVSVPEGTGHCFFAIRVDSLRLRNDYEASVRRLAAAVHAAPRAGWAEPFLIPGEREARVATVRSAAIPIAESVLHLLRSLGDEFGVPLPERRRPD